MPTAAGTITQPGTAWRRCSPSGFGSACVTTAAGTAAPNARRARGFGARSEDDLAGLIEALGCAPAHVVGNSFGASTALVLALRRPELFCSLTIHEPPLIGAASAQPRLRPQLDEVEATIGSAAALHRDGDLVGGAKRFVEDVALGPGAWQELPPDVREEIVRDARGFLGDIEDPGWADLDLAASVRIGCPALVTWGSQSPSWLREVATFVAGRIEGAQSRQLEGSGHLPHMTHPGVRGGSRGFSCLDDSRAIMTRGAPAA